MQNPEPKSDLELTECSLCLEESCCLSGATETGRKLNLANNAYNICRLKTYPRDPKSFRVCLTCIVFLNTASSFIKTSKSKQKSVILKLTKFYENKTWREAWNFSETEPLPNLKFAPCQLCAQWNASILAFSTFGTTLKLPLKIKKITGIKLDSHAPLSPPICVNCIVLLNKITEDVDNMKKRWKKTRRNPSCFTDADSPPQTLPDLTIPPETNVPDVEETDLSAAQEMDWSSIMQEAMKEVEETNEAQQAVQIITAELSESSGSPDLLTEMGQEKKDRKTVCIICKRWIPRSIMEEHQALHVGKLEVDLD